MGNSEFLFLEVCKVQLEDGVACWIGDSEEVLLRLLFSLFRDEGLDYKYFFKSLFQFVNAIKLQSDK